MPNPFRPVAVSAANRLPSLGGALSDVDSAQAAGYLISEQALFASVMDNFERRRKVLRESLNRSLGQKARHAKAELRALAERLRRES